MKTESIDHGRVLVAAEFASLLRANGLDSFEAIMSLAGGRVARNFPGRRTVRLELKTDAGVVQAVYLKRYEAGYLSGFRKLLRWLNWPGAGDEAMQEWQALHAVQALEIPTAVPIAVGQERVGGLVRRSFLMTAEIAGAVEGHTWMAALPTEERRQFLRRVAMLARRFHGAGFLHRPRARCAGGWSARAVPDRSSASDETELVSISLASQGSRRDGLLDA